MSLSALLIKVNPQAFWGLVKTATSGMVTRFMGVYRESKPYCKTRGDFMFSDFWKTLSVISVLYLAFAMVISPLILWGKLQVGVFMCINVIWGFLLIGFYGSFFIALLVCSLSGKGRKWFDKRIHYKDNNLEGNFTAIESRLNEIETKLDNHIEGRDKHGKG